MSRDKQIEEMAKISDLRTLSTKTVGEAIWNTPTAVVGNSIDEFTKTIK